MNHETHNTIGYDLTDAEVQFYNDQGYLYMPGFVRREAAGALRAEVLEIMREVFGLDADRLGRAEDAKDALRQSNQYLAGSRLDELINGERTKAVAGRLIGGNAHVYLPFTAVKAGGGGGKFHLHQDNQYTNHYPAEGSLNIWVALVDMSPENGCLQISPHSQKDGPLLKKAELGKGDFITPESEAHRLFQLRMCAGDAVAFTRLTVHGSGPNNTSDPRVAYALQYHREDVEYDHPETGGKQRLVDSPRFKVGPVEKLTPQ
ncbi:MAG: phytanoyl-CoA dioxygenase family protein [Planctomycetota bacterium]